MISCPEDFEGIFSTKIDLHLGQNSDLPSALIKGLSQTAKSHLGYIEQP